MAADTTAEQRRKRGRLLYQQRPAEPRLRPTDRTQRPATGALVLSITPGLLNEAEGAEPAVEQARGNPELFLQPRLLGRCSSWPPLRVLFAVQGAQENVFLGAFLAHDRSGEQLNRQARRGRAAWRLSKLHRRARHAPRWHTRAAAPLNRLAHLLHRAGKTSSESIT